MLAKVQLDQGAPGKADGLGKGERRRQIILRSAVHRPAGLGFGVDRAIDVPAALRKVRSGCAGTERDSLRLVRILYADDVTIDAGQGEVAVGCAPGPAFRQFVE